MKKECTCCFTGHRSILASDRRSIQKSLKKNLLQLIEEGYLYFVSGGALGFDLLAAQTVIQQRQKYPQIKLIMMLPCYDQDKFWNEEQKAQYHTVLAAADEVIYISKAYDKGCMFRRNRALVDSASCVLAYLNQNTGGTKYTVDYADKVGTNVLFINPAKKYQLSFFS